MSRQKSTTEKPAGRQPKKIEAKSPAEKVVEKPARKSATRKSPDFNIELQYAGKAVSLSEIIDKAKEACGDKADLYIKPEENRVYFVSDGEVGSFEI